MKTRRSFVALLGASSLSACAAPAIVARDGADPFEGGIGGTGIVGVVTGFSSILVNGLKVEVTERTEFQNALGASTLDTLHPGHSVTIAAARGPNGLVARRVTHDQLLVGTLRIGTRGIIVNGIPLRREPGSLGGAPIGTRVVVSGVWAADGVVASRIDLAPDGPDVISGTADSGRGLLSISGTPIETTRPKNALNGSFTVAIGNMSDGGFNAERVREGRFSGFRSLAQISAEGFLEPSERAPSFRVAGLGHSFARDTRLGEIGQRRALYFGRYDGLFGANRGYVVPENFSDRRRVLEAGLGDAFAGQVLSL